MLSNRGGPILLFADTFDTNYRAMIICHHRIRYYTSILFDFNVMISKFCNNT